MTYMNINATNLTTTTRDGCPANASRSVNGTAATVGIAGEAGRSGTGRPDLIGIGNRSRMSELTCRGTVPATFYTQSPATIQDTTMMTAKKPKYRPRVGDERWFVEWCHELGWHDEDTKQDVDRDACKMTTRMVMTREEAIALAKEVWPRTHETFGIVEYWPATFTAYDEADAAQYPHAGFWEDTADAECYEGDE